MKIHRRSKRRGCFTLANLLLMMAVLAVLAFFVGPAIAGGIRNARMRTCASNEILVELTIWRWYADQAEAGKVLLVGNAPAIYEIHVDDVKLLMAQFDSVAAPAAIAQGGELDNLQDYFTPAGFPKCPFNRNKHTYGVILRFNLDGGLLDVECQCSGAYAHPRLPDRERSATTPG